MDEDLKIVPNSKFELVHAVMIDGADIEEFNDNLGSMLNYIQCELKGKIKDIKYMETGNDDNVYFTALIIYYHTFVELED